MAYRLLPIPPLGSTNVPKIRLTKTVIDKLMPGRKDAVYWDEALAGFGLKVTPKGRKVFIVMYRTRDPAARLRKYTIGPYGPTTLASARVVAQKVLAARAEGRDPAAERREARRRAVLERVEAVAEDFLVRNCLGPGHASFVEAERRGGSHARAVDK